MKHIIHFLGTLLIILAYAIDIFRKMFWFVFVVGIFIGLFMVTMITFFDLVSPHQEIGIFEDWYWNLIVSVFAGTTFVLTLLRLGGNVKLMEGEIK